MLVGPRTGASGRMVLAHCAGTRRGFVPSGKVVGTSPSCSRAVARGLEKRVLDGVNARPLAGSGCGSFCRGPLHWIRGWGLPMGSIPAAAHW